MYYIMSYESVISFFANMNIDITLFTQFQITVIWLGCNVLAIIFWLAIVSMAYKIICRFFRF